MRNSKLFILSCLAVCLGELRGQVTVDVNLNIEHSVGDISEFQRHKFITIHSDIISNEWLGKDNFTDNIKADFFKKRNVFLGRSTAAPQYHLRNIKEDPQRKGYADPTMITQAGIESKNYYLTRKWIHGFEERTNMVLSTQFSKFWTGRSQQPTAQGWKFDGAEAVGDYLGRFLKNTYGGFGRKEVPFFEIINEPAYETLGGAYNYTNTTDEIADYHVKVARELKKHAPDVKVGGYTAAFPNLDLGGFKRWENRWKRFIDLAGDDMDFWSLHLYDFPSIRNGKKILRSGSNIEATFDMIDHYTQLSRKEIKPYIISEFGAQTHDYMRQQWSSYRDWLHIKALNSQLMAFLERPNTIEMVIPYIMEKAKWGYRDNIPHQRRLFRKENEPESYTGKWVYTDLVKFYDLWKNVEGTRVDTYAINLDVLVDTYVKDNKAYVILNNLNFDPIEIKLNLNSISDNKILELNKRHLTLTDNTVNLEEDIYNEVLTDVLLGAESTMILEYTFDKPIIVNETSKETKYYADSYYKPITAGYPESFVISNLKTKKNGEAILRLGLGRDHKKSLQPILKINGTSVEVPSNFRGYDQADRISYFGVLEIPIPYHLLKEKNTVELIFPDSGGHISSVCMQVFNFSKPIERSQQLNVAAN